MNTQSSFLTLDLAEPIKKALTECGYEQPTPIQQQCIPQALLGKDILGTAQTGTGKTAAFALPILDHLFKNSKSRSPKSPRVLVVSPTRELAVQIFESFKTYGKYLNVRSMVIFGGVSQLGQVRDLSHGVDVLVATPGRLLDLIHQKHIVLSQLDFFVLDEVDRMLDMGFLPDIKKIIPFLPKKRQSLFFSATMPLDIKKLADSLLVNPIHVKVAPVSSTAEMIDQSVMFVDKARKKDLLLYLLKKNRMEKVIIFTRTKHGANRLAETLIKNQITTQAIHGNKSQNARLQALDNLRKGKNRVLVATDIVARGIDIDNISHVINYELPNISESYVHRIGRTARAGTSGIAISLCDSEEKAYLRDIEKLIGKPISLDKTHPFHSHQVENEKTLSKGKAKALIDSRHSRRPSHRSGPRFPKSKPNS